jgi:hypothetical protein
MNSYTAGDAYMDHAGGYYATRAQDPVAKKEASNAMDTRARRGPNGGWLYQKSPVEVEMMQMTDDNWDDLVKYANHLVRYDAEDKRYFVFDHLHRSWIEFFIGDWIATGPDGEHYPINRDMQPKTYSPVYDA